MANGSSIVQRLRSWLPTGMPIVLTRDRDEQDAADAIEELVAALEAIVWYAQHTDDCRMYQQSAQDGDLCCCGVAQAKLVLAKYRLTGEALNDVSPKEGV